MNNHFLERTELLIGSEAIKKLSNSKVIVFGVGGVGGFAIESLVRAGIGNIAIIDYDIIDITNINRQIIALQSTLGLLKVEVMKERIENINPYCNVTIYSTKLDKNSLETFNLKNFDYIVDAIDDVKGKLLLAAYSYNNNVKIISSMGTGNKLDPTRFLVSDIKDTRECPLARVMRNKLKKLGINKYKVVWSDEPIKGERFYNDITKKISPSSISFVPPVAGLILSSEVIKDLISGGE